MIIKLIVIAFLQLCIISTAFGQKHDFNWLLGTYPLKGDLLTFHNYDLEISLVDKTIPFNITNSTMSSASGEYVFSFNSLKIQNKMNEMMDNSDSLKLGSIPGLYANFGGPFTQGSISLPSQKDSNQFLLIYWDQKPYVYKPDSSYAAPFHLYMAIIDKRGDSGSGTVIRKNILLVSDTLANAGIMATKHANGRDWWIIVPEIVSNRYHTLLVSRDSLIQQFSQSIGIVWPPYVDISSQSVFSSNGTKYVRFSDQVGLQLFDFDRCTGFLSNPDLVSFAFDENYFSGAAMSKSGRFVYVSDVLNLYQYDLWSNDIASSKTLIDTYDGFTNPYHCDFLNPQLAPDGKIYLASWGGCKNLHVINHPERKGQDCDFRQHQINLNVFHYGGLPNNPNYRLGPIDGSACDTLGIDNIPLAAFRYDRDSNDYLQVEFTELSDYEPQTWFWDFGDGDTSWLRYPVHHYDSSGNYQACLTVSNQNGSDIYCKTIQLEVSGTISPVSQSKNHEIYFAIDTKRLVVNSKEIEALIISDSAGRIVYKVDQLTDWIDLSTLEGGFYIWHAKDKKGKSSSGTFIKI